MALDVAGQSVAHEALHATSRELMKGNHALCEAAIRAGCRYYFGYPITPQNEVTEHMAERMPDVDGTFVQAESEVAAINMVYGAAACGQRVMTSSSSPGISLKQEGISYIATAELPAVIVNVVRCGPGLGNIAPHQGDYFQATKGGGHGDYRLLVLAPDSVQELADLTYLAFDLAEQYRIPAMILADGTIGQMMEGVDLSTLPARTATPQPWALRIRQPGEKSRFLTTIHLQPPAMAVLHQHLKDKYEAIRQSEIRYENFMTDDADLVVVAYGTSSRVCRSAIRNLRARGVKVGMLRPITLWPFPYEALANLAKGPSKAFMVAEMSFGQMVEDVALAIAHDKPLHFVGKDGGMLFETDELETAMEAVLANPAGAPTRFSLF